MWLVKQLLIALDQCFNVLFGSGWADETLSAYFYRTKHWMEPIVDHIFFWQDRHCYNSYMSERNRMQMPAEYRSC